MQPTTKKKVQKPIVLSAPAVGEMYVTQERLLAGDRTVLSIVSMEEFIALLKGGSHRKAVELLRTNLPDSMGAHFSHSEVQHVPRVCPAGSFRRWKGALKMKRLNGLLWLDIRNVYSADEAARIKAKAAKLPMTVAAFVGSSGMSVKILVSYWPVDGVQPLTLKDADALHAEAYRQACTVYGPLLEHPISRPEELTVRGTMRLSLDPDVLYRPDAQSMPVALITEFSNSPLAVAPEEDIADSVKNVLPVGEPPADSQHFAYYRERYLEARHWAENFFEEAKRDETIERVPFLETLAACCYDMQIPQAEARMHIVEELPEDKQAARLIVDDYYALQAQKKNNKGKMASGVREMQRLLAVNYEIYRNEIDGGLYYRPRTTEGSWQPLGLEKQRGMELEMLEAGVLKTTKPVQTFLMSDRIPRRNPVADFLVRVKGRWDGKDRIRLLARCVEADNPLWERAFHIWFLAMVRQWMGIESDHGNDVMPLLCGPQGTGKSTFCRRLLPDVLRWGYLDHIDLSKRAELMRLMAQMLLINIDEFDQYKGGSQRGPLKNVLQQVDIRTRQMRRQNIQIRQRLASFIATCNPSEVLVDETGTRRFICVRVKKYIEVPEKFDYVQLYAQAVAEINMRRQNPESYSDEDPTGRCYFTDEERENIERNNQHFRARSIVVERFCDLFEPQAERHKKGDILTVELSRSEVAEYIGRHIKKQFSREDYTQLNAYLEQLVNEGKLYKRRASKTNVYHLKRKSRPII
ncbi:MAG: hypothetical protein K6C30_02825 [Bacteroidaceae bacterium]|nr:hypothetical protein [Bacteroidaceae bacterium]